MKLRRRIARAHRRLNNLAVTERQINAACDQMQIILNKIQEVSVRHQRVPHSHQEPDDCPVHLELITLHTVYAMYYKYANRKVHQLATAELTPGGTTISEDLPNTQDLAC